MQFASSHSVQGAVPVAIPNNVYPCATKNGERAIVPFTVFRFNVSSEILSYEHLAKEGYVFVTVETEKFGYQLIF